MAIRGIFFDAADVLYRRPEPTDQYVSKLLHANGLSTDVDGDGRMCLKGLRSQANRGHLNPGEYWNRYLLIHGAAGPEQREALAAKIIDYSNHVLPVPGGREALTGLRRRGFVLGIVTNTIYPLESKMRWLDQLGMAELIDVVACSTVLGVQKPHPAIYLAAVKQARLTPGESAFVGHDTRELAGARRAGLATVAVNHDSDTKADYYAHSLPDLLTIPIFHDITLHKVE